jgi:Tyrosine phosphatase family
MLVDLMRATGRAGTCCIPIGHCPTNWHTPIGNSFAVSATLGPRCSCIADRSYIEAAFGNIEKRHGTVANYLADALGANAAPLGELRGKLTAPRA